MQQALAVLPELAGQLPHSVRLSASHWMQETQERWEQLAVQGWVGGAAGAGASCSGSFDASVLAAFSTAPLASSFR